jgi:hypothetical protein
MAKDYLIEVRVKNGYLHGKMREKGFHTNVALSEKSGVDQSRISEFLNLRSYPMSRKTGEWLSGVMKLAEALDCGPEDLFPAQHLQNPLQKNKAEFALNLDEFTMLAGDDTPETRMLADETRATVHGALDKLADANPRKAKAVREHFFEDATLQEIGDNMTRLNHLQQPDGVGVSSSRARSLLHVGMRDLKKILAKDFRDRKRHGWSA